MLSKLVALLAESYRRATPTLSMTRTSVTALGCAPALNFSKGGSPVGRGPVLEQILKLDFDVVVPSTAPVITRDDLVAFKTKIDILASRARRLVGERRLQGSVARPTRYRRFRLTVQLHCERSRSVLCRIIRRHSRRRASEKVMRPLKDKAVRRSLLVESRCHVADSTNPGSSWRLSNP